MDRTTWTKGHIITLELRPFYSPADSQRSRLAHNLRLFITFLYLDRSTGSTALSTMARTTIATTAGTRAQTLLEPAPNLPHHTPTLTGTLRLRAVPPESRHIRWSEDVIDNEGLGRKKSKRNVPLLLPERNHPPPIDLFRSAAVVGGI